MQASVWLLTLAVALVSCEDVATTSSSTIGQPTSNNSSIEATVAPGCSCASVNCKTCSLAKGACCRSCCREQCRCPGLDCSACNGTSPCCQVCCQSPPNRTSPGLLGLRELVLPNVTVVVNQPQIVVRAPQNLRAPALCCGVDQPATCSPYGCASAKTSVTCGPQCWLARWSAAQRQQGLRKDCYPLYSWPYVACPPLPQRWSGYEDPWL